MRTMFFHELKPGARFDTVLSNPISAESIDTYFELTGDRFDIHRDDAYARTFGLRAAMAPGNLVTACATGLMFEQGPYRQSLFVQAAKHTKFVRPLFVGSRIRVTDEVIACEDRPGKPYGRVLLKRAVFDEQGELVQSIDQDYRIVKR